MTITATVRIDFPEKYAGRPQPVRSIIRRGVGFAVLPQAGHRIDPAPIGMSEVCDSMVVHAVEHTPQVAEAGSPAPTITLIMPWAPATRFSLDQGTLHSFIDHAVARGWEAQPEG